MCSTPTEPLDPLTLDVYAGKDGEFRLYEDDGILDYRTGGYAWTPFRFSSDKPGGYSLRIGPAQGKFRGQLAKRRYVVRIHGLFKPDTVRLNGGKLAEMPADQECSGWSWDARTLQITVRLPKLLSTHKEAVVEFANTGTFADLCAWQKAWNLRAQVRQAKRDMKLKHAQLVSGPGIKKPPRVIRETEKVEQLLTDLIDHPKGCGQAPPDYAALQQRVLAALTNDPFESNRTLPELDPDSLKGMELVKGAKFTPEEIQTITNRFRGPGLPAWLWSGR